jgi:hypothetical protein
MRPLRFRLLLPLIFGCLAISLVAWEYHYQRVVAAMGMGWDTGPPIWPYQASWILLQAINAPAFALDLVLVWLLRVRPDALLPLELPTIFLWWWFVGWRIDVGLLPGPNLRLRRLWGTVLGTASLALWSCAIYLVQLQVKFWIEYGQDSWRGPMLYLMRNSGILCWCLLLGFWSTAATLRVATLLRNRYRKSGR